MNRRLRKIIIFTLIIFVFSLSVISMKNKNTEIVTNAENISNKKLGWGIKRNDNHEQPDVGSNNKKVLENNEGICLGNKEKKYLYLTFDEGYEAGYTPHLLKTLKENEVKATFFITAHFVNTNSDCSIKSIIFDGIIVLISLYL